MDVSQLDCMVAQNGVPLTSYLMSGLMPWEVRKKYLGLRFIGMFEASDGWVFIHTSPRMHDRLSEGTGIEELEDRRQLEEWASERTVQEIVESLVEVEVPVAPINSLEEAIKDPQVKHRGMIVELEHPEADTVKTVNFPVKFSKSPAKIRMAAPLLGQHNNEVLTDLLGYGEDEIETLRRVGVIT